MKRIISFFEIPAADFYRAVDFYQTIFNVKMSVMDCEIEKMAFFPEEDDGFCPGAISYSPYIQPNSVGGILISLNIDDMEKGLSLVEKNGGKVIIPKTKIEAENRGYFSVFTDSEGNKMGFYSDK